MITIFDRIIEQPDQVREIMADLHSGETSGRRQAITIIKELISRFVEPESSSLILSNSGDLYFDLDQAAGVEISGLALGLLKKDFPGLGVPDDDDKLAAALDHHGINISNAAQRKSFFHIWTALRATYVIRELLTIFNEQYQGEEKDSLAEIETLQHLSDLKIPTIDKQIIKAIINRRSKSHNKK